MDKLAEKIYNETVAYIQPYDHEEWKKAVTARAGDLYQGMDVYSAIDVIKILNGPDNLVDSLEKAGKLLDDQNHSGASYGMALRMILHFSPNGASFYKHCEPERAKDPKTMKVLEEIEEKHRSNGAEIKKDDGLGLTSAERKVYDETLKYIQPYDHVEYAKALKNRMSDLYQGRDLLDAIEVIKVLAEEGELAERFTKASELLDEQNHSGASYSMTLKVVTHFSPIGTEFYKHCEPERAEEPEVRANLDRIRQKHEAHLESTPTQTLKPNTNPNS